MEYNLKNKWVDSLPTFPYLLIYLHFIGNFRNKSQWTEKQYVAMTQKKLDCEKSLNEIVEWV